MMKENPKRVELIDGTVRTYDRVSYESGWLHGYIDTPPGSNQRNATLPSWRVLEIESTVIDQ